MTLVRVRGGSKGFRMVELDDWKREQLEKKGKLRKVMSQGAKKQEAKHRQKRKQK